MWDSFGQIKKSLFRFVVELNKVFLSSESRARLFFFLNKPDWGHFFFFWSKLQDPLLNFTAFILVEIVYKRQQI